MNRRIGSNGASGRQWRQREGYAGYMPSLPGYNTFRGMFRPYVDTLANGGTVLPKHGNRRGVPMPLYGDTSWLLGEHITIYGMTGSGKTYLSKHFIHLAREYNPNVNVYILDTKSDDVDFHKWRTRIKSANAPLVSKSNRAYTLIWQPTGTIRQTREQVDIWFRSILRAKANAVVLVNDLKDISPTPEKSPDSLAELLRDGRSFGISVLALTQEAAYVPREIHNQITFAIRMLMNDSYDVAKVHRTMGGTKPLGVGANEIPQPPKYGFYIARLDTAPRVIKYFSNVNNLL